MRLFGGRTIGQKLTTISMLSSITALLSASLAFLAYDLHSFRESMTQRIQTDAQIIAFNSISALVFDDPETATAILGGLRGDAAVVSAVIRAHAAGSTTAERPFASYLRDARSSSLSTPVPSGLEASHVLSGERLLVTEPIRFEETTIGTLVIEAELSEIRDRRRRYAVIALGVLGMSLILALTISRRVERSISRPILHLSETARAVSLRKDYSVRAEGGGTDEIAQLVTTFNEMLDEIHRQNAALEEARTELEHRVDTRTRDLAAANKELEAFSYSVSHDLRAPLRAIDGFSKALLTSHGDVLDEQGRHYLARVRSGTLRMADLIDDLLGLARISRQELVRRKIDLSEIANRVLSEMSAQATGRPVSTDVEAGLTANADPRLVTVILENLLGNAWKFSARNEAARIEVGRQVDGSETIFYVRDNGAGFDMKYADKLFGAFQRLHSDAEFEGTGIGLATVQRIVTRHGGRIWAESELGKGTTFYFTLERPA
jgi:signal transduction histidine kinase